MKLFLVIQLAGLLLASVASDVTAHLQEGTICGIAILAGIPWLDPDFFARVNTPFAKERLPNLNREDSTSTVLAAGTGFVDALFYNAEETPWETRALWVGAFFMQTPRDRILAMSRPQDPTKFLEQGKKGLPLLIIGGREDRPIDTSVVIKEMEPHFPKMKVVWIEEKGSHAMFYDNMEETMKAILNFMNEDGEFPTF